MTTWPDPVNDAIAEVERLSAASKSTARADVPIDEEGTIAVVESVNGEPATVEVVTPGDDNAY